MASLPCACRWNIQQQTIVRLSVQPLMLSGRQLHVGLGDSICCQPRHVLDLCTDGLLPLLCCVVCAAGQHAK